MTRPLMTPDPLDPLFRHLGMQQWVHDIEILNPVHFCEGLDTFLSQRSAIRETLHDKITEERSRVFDSGRTVQQAASLLSRDSRVYGRSKAPRILYARHETTQESVPA